MGRLKSLVIVGLLAIGLVGLALMGYGLAADSPVQMGAVDAAPLTEDPEAIEIAPPDQVSGQDPANSAANGYQEGFTEDGSPFRGDPSAPVVIEEFSSYQCPFCSRYFQESYVQIVDNYVQTSRALYVFHDFPLPSQPQSPVAAEAARCAGEQGAYWEMHDLIFGRQSQWSGRVNAADLFKEYASELELDRGSFDGCLDSGSMRSLVAADAAEGGARGVRGTPTFFVNGQPLVGAQPFAVFAQALDAALAGEQIAAEPAVAVAAPTPAAIASADDALVLGDPDAPVTIVEFSDYQCPFCARHLQETWPQIEAEFIDTGRARYVFKDLPLTGIHPQAHKAHQAARCAGEQGEYWAMHDRLFAGQSEWAERSNHVDIFKAYAAELGLDTATFDACLDSGNWTAAVNMDLAEGATLGVQGTPAFFINGYPIFGAQPYEVFQYAIELAEQGRLGEAYQVLP